jgi:hypothetical protein
VTSELSENAVLKVTADDLASGISNSIVINRNEDEVSENGTGRLSHDHKDSLVQSQRLPKPGRPRVYSAEVLALAKQKLGNYYYWHERKLSLSRDHHSRLEKALWEAKA